LIVDTTYPPSDFDEATHEENKAPSLQLEHILGVKTTDARHNVHLIDSETVIFHSGRLAVVQDLGSGEQVFFTDHLGEIINLTVNKECTRVATCEHSGTNQILIWDASTFRTLYRLVHSEGKRPFTLIQFSPDGLYLVGITQTPECQLVVFHVTSGKIVAMQKSSPEPCLGMAVSVQAASVVTVGPKHVRFWKTDMKLRTLTHRSGVFGKLASLQTVLCVVEAADGSGHWTGMYNGDICRWSGNTVIFVITAAHKGPVVTLGFSGDDLLVSAGKDGRVVFWTPGGENEKEFQLEEAESTSLMRSLSIHGNQLVLLSSTATIFHLDLGRAQQEGKVIHEGHTAAITAMAVHPSMATLVTASADKYLRLWENFHVICSIILPATCTHLSFSPLGDAMVVGLENGGFMVLEPATLSVVEQIQDRTVPVCCTQYSPNGLALAVAAQEGTIDMYVVDEHYAGLGTCVGHTCSIDSLAWTTDSRTLMSAGGREVLTWDAKSLQPLSAKDARDFLWQSWTSTRGWPVIGIWGGSGATTGNDNTKNKSSKVAAGNEVTSLCRFYDANDVPFVAVGYQTGDIAVYPWPAYKMGMAHSTVRVHSGPVGLVACDVVSGKVYTAGATDGMVCVWNPVALEPALKIDKEMEKEKEMKKSEMSSSSDALVLKLKTTPVPALALQSSKSTSPPRVPALNMTPLRSQEQGKSKSSPRITASASSARRQVTSSTLPQSTSSTSLSSVGSSMVKTHSNGQPKLPKISTPRGQTPRGHTPRSRGVQSAVTTPRRGRSASTTTTPRQLSPHAPPSSSEAGSKNLVSFWPMQSPVYAPDAQTALAHPNDKPRYVHSLVGINAVPDASLSPTVAYFYPELAVVASGCVLNTLKVQGYKAGSVSPESVAAVRDALFLTHPSAITCVAVNAKKLKVATAWGNRNSQIKLSSLRPNSESQLLRTKELEPVHERAICLMAFSDDGSVLVSVGGDTTHTIAVWDTSSGSLLAMNRGSGDAIRSIVFEPGNNHSFLTASPKCLRRWTLQKQATLGLLNAQTLLSGSKFQPPATFRQAIYGPEQSIWCGTESGDIVVAKNGKIATLLEKAHGGPICKLAACEQGVLSGGVKGEVRLWSMQGTMVKEWNFPSAALILSLQYCSEESGESWKNGSLLVATGEKRVWEIVADTEDQQQLVLQAHVGDIWGVDVDVAQQQFITGGDDGWVCVWDVRSPYVPLSSRQMGCPVRAVALHPSAPTVAVGLENGKIDIIDYVTLTTVQSIKAGEESVYVLRYAPNGSILAAVASDSQVQLFAVERNYEVYGFLAGGHKLFITHLDWDVSSTFMVTNGADYEVSFWEVAKMHLVANKYAMRNVEWATYTCPLSWATCGIWQGKSNGTDINSVARSANRRLLAVADDAGLVQIYRFPAWHADARAISMHVHANFVTKAVFVGDAFLVCTGGVDGTVAVLALQPDLDAVLTGIGAGKTSSLSSSSLMSGKTLSGKASPRLSAQTPSPSSRLSLVRRLSSTSTGMSAGMSPRGGEGERQRPLSARSATSGRRSILSPRTLKVQASPRDRRDSPWASASEALELPQVPRSVVVRSRQQTATGSSRAPSPARRRQLLSGLEEEGGLSRAVHGQTSVVSTAFGAAPPPALLNLSLQIGYSGSFTRHSIKLLGTGEIIYPCAKNVVLQAVESGQQRYYVGHKGSVSALTVHPNGVLVASGEISKDAAIRVWDSTTLETMAELRVGHLVSIVTLAFAPSGKHLFSVDGSREHRLNIWLWERTLNVHSEVADREAVFSIAPHPYLDMFMTTGLRHARSWSFDELTYRTNTFKMVFGHLAEPQSIGCGVYAPDGAYLAGTFAGDLFLFRGSELCGVVPAVHQAAIMDMSSSLSPDFDTQYVATAGLDSWVHLFTLASLTNMESTARNNVQAVASWHVGEGVRSLSQVQEDGSLFAGTSLNNIYQLQRREENGGNGGNVVSPLVQGFPAEISAMDVCGPLTGAVSTNGYLCWLDVRSGKVIAKTSSRQNQNSLSFPSCPCACAFVPVAASQGVLPAFMLVGCVNGEVVRVHRSGEDTLYEDTVARVTRSAITCVTVAGNGKIAVIGTADGRVFPIETVSDALSRIGSSPAVDIVHAAAVVAMDIGCTGQSIKVRSQAADGSVKTSHWSLQAGATTTDIQASPPVLESLRCVLTLHADTSAAYTRDVSGEDPRDATLLMSSAMLNSSQYVAYSGDCDAELGLLALGLGNSVVLHNYPIQKDAPSEARIYPLHAGEVAGVRFGLEGTKLISTGGGDSVLCIWNVEPSLDLDDAALEEDAAFVAKTRLEVTRRLEIEKEMEAERRARSSLEEEKRKQGDPLKAQAAEQRAQATQLQEQKRQRRAEREAREQAEAESKRKVQESIRLRLLEEQAKEKEREKERERERVAAKNALPASKKQTLSPRDAGELPTAGKSPRSSIALRQQLQEEEEARQEASLLAAEYEQARGSEISKLMDVEAALIAEENKVKEAEEAERARLAAAAEQKKKAEDAERARLVEEMRQAEANAEKARQQEAERLRIAAEQEKAEALRLQEVERLRIEEEQQREREEQARIAAEQEKAEAEELRKAKAQADAAAAYQAEIEAEERAEQLRLEEAAAYQAELQQSEEEAERLRIAAEQEKAEQVRVDEEKAEALRLQEAERLRIEEEEEKERAEQARIAEEAEAEELRKQEVEKARIVEEEAKAEAEELRKAKAQADAAAAYQAEIEAEERAEQLRLEEAAAYQAELQQSEEEAERDAVLVKEKEGNLAKDEEEDTPWQYQNQEVEDSDEDEEDDEDVTLTF
jgi:WD40 repeat protein